MKSSEFKHSVLEALRQPLEDGFVSITRAMYRVEFKTNFLLVGTSNPCPCGMLYEGKFVLNSTLYIALVILTKPSSKGCLNASKTLCLNSLISSKTSIPLLAKLISPGIAFFLHLP